MRELESEYWELLGIEPTEDRRAIRSAYARRLKEIDPESDPRRFIALRAAYENASRTAGCQSPAAVQLESPGRPESRPSDDLPDADQPFRVIEALLYGHRGETPWLDADGQRQLIAQWRLISTDLRMQRLDWYQRVERWASIVIVQTSPMSAPVLMIAAEHFGWLDGDVRLGTDPFIHEIGRRYRMMQVLHKTQETGSPYRAAWIELTTPADPFSTRSNVNPFAVFEVLAAIRYALPELGLQLDPIRAESWEITAQQTQLALLDAGRPHSADGFVKIVRLLWSIALLLFFGFAILLPLSFAFFGSR